MRTIFFYSIVSLISLIGIAFQPGVLYAQRVTSNPILNQQQTGNSTGGSTSISISASATVMSGNIELMTVADMGIVDASRAENDIVYINPVFDAEAGIMKALGEPNAQIRVSYLAEREVFRSDGPGRLLFVYEVSGFPGDNQRQSELLEAMEREVRLNTAGEYFFWIGGRVDVSQAQPGSYEGDFTIEIEYI